MNDEPFDDPYADDEPEGEFICPECGSTAVHEHLLVSPAAPDPSDPWSSVCEMFRCGQCWSWIPAHLARRWGGMSVERAKEEWRERYRQGGLSRVRRERDAGSGARRAAGESEDGSDW